MIIETSAMVALIKDEPEAPTYRRGIEIDDDPKMSAVNYVEAAIVVDRPGHDRFSRLLDSLVESLDISVVPFTEAHARLAREAYRRYGRGSGHRAGLNFGDCFAYALAIDTDEPLLFKGDDFGHTDVRVALAG